MKKFLLIVMYYFVVLMIMYAVTAPAFMFITSSVSMWNPFEWEIVWRLIFAAIHVTTWLTCIFEDKTIFPSSKKD